jgi:hypothetical protein
MSVRIVRLGTPRHSAEGLRIGTVRRPPRGVRKQEYASRDYFDVWLPELAPSAPLGAFHGKTLGNLRAALQVGDEAALSSKADLDAGSVVRAIEFLSGLLL